ncbi:hypothetical protein B0H12DRAFT_1144274 [Mycena haematopus]|nr:hypothetical protein B0H12DRAFT_1144274 [Mycena haematopus]
MSSAAEIASQTLLEESGCRFPSFSASDAVKLGLSIRKRFRSTSRHAKGKGLVISIRSIAGHPLFCCSVGDLGHHAGFGISLDSWSAVEGLINVVKRTGHSSYYVEKGIAAMGKTPKQTDLQGEFRVNGGAFPIWLENAPCCPIAVVACYSGSSQDDHRLVYTTVRDYLAKLSRRTPTDASIPTPPVPGPSSSSDQVCTFSSNDLN